MHCIALASFTYCGRAAEKWLIRRLRVLDANSRARQGVYGFLFSVADRGGMLPAPENTCLPLRTEKRNP